MPFGIHDRKDKPMYTSDRSLYLNADKTEVVEEGDPSAAFLLVGAGSEIEETEAERYGLKSRPAPEDKSVSAPDDDKAGDEPGDGDELACPHDGCDFVAKSAGGLARHQKTHKSE